MGAPVFGYTRVSTEEQAREGVSLDAQRELIERYCRQHELTLVAVLEDKGVSGSIPLVERPRGGELVARLDRSEGEGVVAARLDRLFRSALDCSVVTTRWRERRVGLHALDLNVDTTTPMGEFFLTVLSAFAQMERRVIRERIQTALDHKKRRHERTGGVPYGYRLRENGVDLVPDTAEQAVVRRVLQDHADGQSTAAIARALAAEGVQSRGARWHATTVARMIKRAYKEDADA